MKQRVAAVILSAGMGTRMKSALPKVLHQVAGKPMIGWVLDAVAASGADPMVVVTAPAHDAVRQAVGDRAEVVIQETPLGTGHAALAAGPALEAWCADGGTVLICFGDTPLITPETLAHLVAARAAHDDPAVVVLGFEPEDPGLYGRLLLGADNSLEHIVEARDASPEVLAIGLCNGGVMAIDASILFDLLRRIDNGNAKGEFYLTDLVGLAHRGGRRCTVVTCDPLETQGVDSRAGLARAEAAMQVRLRAAALEGGVTMTAPETVFLCHDTRLAADVTVGPHVVFGSKVVVEEGAEIRAFSHLEGAHVGPGALVGPYARLRPGARIGAQAHIGNFVEVKNAEIETGAKANHLSYIGDARVGAGANIGAGTITCNYDGINKHRTDIGARSFIGSNTALVAPVTVGDGAVIGAGSTVTRNVAGDDLVVVRGETKTIPGGGERLRQRNSAKKKTKG
ncbi:bifunctional UDP-N-acetylglucosamine diphosphorylase/glucosamine-1-phosphate N-acetyltransferase GlmU [Thalassobaculum sp. OXR-137]|uniref:bifunctional UDP-N-acetylglucosamine diphosphorylase/glucosamine-1-phosphate N-acetyltransferase GlmU n=1 Tax=Thalassobaculum sp. OXR-137 TaxID=3100173 RepID=UPI002AC9EDE8|nr:bifunctional UDP-N-acetylglucosamine diphosphorylase/glucosamine-1-phosphate N-acetyltransferase GlmU [Thalassobaculum sp. OXR-137]WPZ33948.1 bifunctional UDP-N-acetylglucosamine diphosphorylase/glucosamine-1-phosphate N-acetyltransferase GlmU [Thalassobaculum sp. OXR-137]